MEHLILAERSLGKPSCLGRAIFLRHEINLLGILCWHRIQSVPVLVLGPSKDRSSQLLLREVMGSLL